MRASTRTKIIRQTLKGTMFAGLALGLMPFASSNALAQSNAILEEIIVTATKREESLQDVPISVATLSGERLNSIFTGGEDILALANRVPGLYAESSNGRAAPRFYLRGLGNIDFDLGASQPVSVIMDEVVMENVVAFEVARVACEKFASDTMREMIGATDAYLDLARKLAK